MQKYDIIYLLKEGISSEELRYSLRSIEKNFEHGKVWFIGGQPEGYIPDARMIIKQDAPTKWENVQRMMREICRNEDITEDFWLFNDDFFIMKPWDSEEALYNDTLMHHIEHIESRHGHRVTAYTERLRECMYALQNEGYKTLNYAIHCPMLINRGKMLETLDKFPGIPMFRSLYGNMHDIGGQDHRDCKIVGTDTMYESEWYSTNDSSFRIGQIGRLIRESFPDKCAYER